MSIPAGRHLIIGTAGHVDHGKSALVQALTGCDPDTLREEKERGMTLRLGFAPLTLPSGLRAGMVDVPGHERLVKTMIAGAAGMDVALLVIAADEGLMPQTREHLAVLELLGLHRGLVVLTKTDLVDEEWLALMEEEIQAQLAATAWAQVAQVAVSARTGQGLAGLLTALDRLAQETPVRPAQGRFRLPVDRVFSLPGFGPVATGTLWSGTVAVGQEIEALGQGKGVPLRVRFVQVHGQERQEAAAGERVALNLAGAGAAQVRRGDWLAAPGFLAPSYRWDVELCLLPQAAPVRQRQRVHLHHGAGEALARLHLLDREELVPGESCFAQLLLETPLPALAQDRFILRSYSPVTTIGGGRVLFSQSPRRKRFRPEEMARLAQLAAGDDLSHLQAALAGEQLPPVFGRGEWAAAADLELEALVAVEPSLEAAGQVKPVAAERYCATTDLERWTNHLQQELTAYHRRYPLRPGCPSGELQTKIVPAADAAAWQILLAYWRQQEILAVTAQTCSLPDWQPQIGRREQAWQQQATALYQQAALMPPPFSQVAAALHIPPAVQREVLAWFARDFLCKNDEEWAFYRPAVTAAFQRLAAAFPLRQATFSLAQARDVWGISRKYALLLLQYSDHQGFTRRQGEERLLLALPAAAE